MRITTGLLIGLLAGLTITVLLVLSLDHSLAPESPASPPSIATDPTAPSSRGASPETKAVPVTVMAPPIPPQPLPAAKPSDPKGALPTTPSVATAAGPLGMQRLAGPAVPIAPTAAAPPATSPAMPVDAAMSMADRRQIQIALHRLGYDPGSVDGLFGSQTRAAIRRFQQAIGAEPTGVITADQARRLINPQAFAGSR